MSNIKPLELHSTMARSSMVDINDIVPTKKALQILGYYNSPFGTGEYVDHYIFEAIEDFQKDNNLKVDGVMKPKGETEKALNEKLSRTANYPGKTRTGLVAPFKDFYNNYEDSKENSGIEDRDKYFHCKANHQAASRGEYGAGVATIASFAKELYDLFWKGNSLEDTIKDLNADAIGWQGGKDKKSLQKSCGQFRSDELDKKY